MRCKRCDATFQKGQEQQHDCTDGLITKIQSHEHCILALNNRNDSQEQRIQALSKTNDDYKARIKKLEELVATLAQTHTALNPLIDKQEQWNQMALGFPCTAPTAEKIVHFLKSVYKTKISDLTKQEF